MKKNSLFSKGFILCFLLINMTVHLWSYNLLIIDSQTSEPYLTVKRIMLEELMSRGFIPGENLTISQWSLGNSSGMARRAWMTEQDNNHDLIFLNGTIAVQSFKEFAFGNEKYRFLFGTVTDPVGLGVIRDFSSYPRSNFTGVAYPVQVRERLRFIMKILPEVRDIGMIYADMSQSHSYIKWLRDALEDEEFSHLRIHFRQVEFIPSELGHLRMIMLAEEHIRELNDKVDLFLSPNDQMGAQPEFAKALSQITDKPLVGLSREDVMDERGALMSIYPSLQLMGIQLADMIEKLLTGQQIKEIMPQWSKPEVAFNLKEARDRGIIIPEEYLDLAGDNIIR